MISTSIKILQINLNKSSIATESAGGRDSTPVHSVPYEPIALLRVYRAKIKLNLS